MELFKIRKDIPFMRHALVLNAVSFITFALAVFFLFSRGLHLSVEFTGGTLMEVSYSQAADLQKVRGTVATLGFSEVQVQNFGSAREVLIRLPAQKGVSSAQQSDKVLTALKANDPDVTLRRTEFVGPQVGDELAEDGLKALAFVVIGIMIYLAIRFEWKFAVSAIIANLHDVIIILGFFAFFQWEFSLAVLAAVLAVLGYSVNESVVIFDRIRENFRRYRKMNTVEIIDNAITSTISRTIITHGSTQIMVLSMLLFGGETLHYFAMALTIGICFGIYSSVFVAAAIAMWLGLQREDLIKPLKKDNDPNDENSGAVVSGGSDTPSGEGFLMRQWLMAASMSVMWIPAMVCLVRGAAIIAPEALTSNASRVIQTTRLTFRLSS
jgi:preprotein translocase subunit SecF